MANQQASIATVEIESDQTYRDIRNLGYELREGPERAIAVAVAEKLARIRAEERVSSGLADRIYAMILETAKLIPADADDSIDNLYDGNGLPR